MYICKNLGDAGVVVDVDDMLGDIGEDNGQRDSRRRHQWPVHNDIGGGPDNQPSSPTQNQNVFGFITEWITSVSFMKGTKTSKRRQNQLEGEREREREFMRERTFVIIFTKFSFFHAPRRSDSFLRRSLTSLQHPCHVS